MDRPEPNAELRQTFEPLRTAFAVLALLLGMLACARADPLPPRSTVTAAGVIAPAPAASADDAEAALDTGAGLFALLLALGLGRTRQRH